MLTPSPPAWRAPVVAIINDRTDEPPHISIRGLIEAVARRDLTPPTRRRGSVPDDGEDAEEPGR